MTQDQYSNQYTYDGEGRILTAGAGSYTYDGDGNRVKKLVGATTTLYWPGGSAVLNESDSTGATMARQVYLGGAMIWHESTAGNGVFLLGDHLGSARITGDAAGNLKDDIDYYPFGAVAANYGNAPSDNHYKFTGYEADDESSTDYAVFRNHSYSMGRFNRPDPYDGSYDSADPQSLNRYAYVSNRPLRAVDPLGLDPSCVDVDGSYDFGCMGDGLGFVGVNDNNGKPIKGPTESVTAYSGPFPTIITDPVIIRALLSYGGGALQTSGGQTGGGGGGAPNNGGDYNGNSPNYFLRKPTGQCATVLNSYESAADKVNAKGWVGFWGPTMTGAAAGGGGLLSMGKALLLGILNGAAWSGVTDDSRSQINSLYNSANAQWQAAGCGSSMHNKYD